MSELYEDEYYRGFGSGEYEDLKSAQRNLEAESSWEIFEGTMVAEACPSPIDCLEEIANGSPIPYEVYADTYDHSQLRLIHGTTKTCIRDCAMPSLIATSGVNGPAHKKMPPDRLGRNISDGLEFYARPKNQLLYRGGKISAVLSMDYEIMPISKLLDTCDFMELTFGASEFVAGSLTHSQTFAQWEFPSAAEDISKDYNAVLTVAGRPSGELLIPVVQFLSSDTAMDSATLLTYLKLEGKYLIPIGKASVKHLRAKSGTSRMEQFEEEVSQLFSKLKFDIGELLPKMIATPIRHPANTFIGLCDYANIPQKWGGAIEEELRSDWPDGSDCSFLDIYKALAETTAAAVEEGYTPYSQRVLDLEEGISKIARNTAKWTAYDLPGTVAWNPAKVAKD